MAKIYSKTELEYKNGYIVSADGDIIGIDNEVVDLFNKLDTDLQRAEWKKEHAEGLDLLGKALSDEFTPVSEYGTPKIGVNTPLLDAKVEETRNLMDELDGLNAAEQANRYIAGIRPVCMFVQDENVVSFDVPRQHRFDLPRIGNPLKLDLEGLGDLVCQIHG